MKKYIFLSRFLEILYERLDIKYKLKQYLIYNQYIFDRDKW